MTVSNKPGHRGEREVSRKTIARGMPGLLRCTCGDYTRVFFITHEAAGALGTRHSLRPLFSLGERSCKTSGAPRREIAESYLNWDNVIARSDLSAVAQQAKAEATKQSTLTSRQYGLLRLRSQ